MTEIDIKKERKEIATKLYPAIIEYITTGMPPAPELLEEVAAREARLWGTLPTWREFQNGHGKINVFGQEFIPLPDDYVRGVEKANELYLTRTPILVWTSSASTVNDPGLRAFTFVDPIIAALMEPAVVAPWRPILLEMGHQRFVENLEFDTLDQALKHFEQTSQPMLRAPNIKEDMNKPFELAIIGFPPPYGAHPSYDGTSVNMYVVHGSNALAHMLGRRVINPVSDENGIKFNLNMEQYVDALKNRDGPAMIIVPTPYHSRLIEFQDRNPLLKEGDLIVSCGGDKAGRGLKQPVIENPHNHNGIIHLNLLGDTLYAGESLSSRTHTAAEVMGPNWMHFRDPIIYGLTIPYIPQGGIAQEGEKGFRLFFDLIHGTARPPVYPTDLITYGKEGFRLEGRA